MKKKDRIALRLLPRCWTRRMQNSTKANAKKETATREQSERAPQNETKNRYRAITSIATRLPVRLEHSWRCQMRAILCWSGSTQCSQIAREFRSIRFNIRLSLLSICSRGEILLKDLWSMFVWNFKKEVSESYKRFNFNQRYAADSKSCKRRLTNGCV